MKSELSPLGSLPCQAVFLSSIMRNIIPPFFVLSRLPDEGITSLTRSVRSALSSFTRQLDCRSSSFFCMATLAILAISPSSPISPHQKFALAHLAHFPKFVYTHPKKVDTISISLIVPTMPTVPHHFFCTGTLGLWDFKVSKSHSLTSFFLTWPNWPFDRFLLPNGQSGQTVTTKFRLIRNIFRMPCSKMQR